MQPDRRQHTSRLWHNALPNAPVEHSDRYGQAPIECDVPSRICDRPIINPVQYSGWPSDVNPPVEIVTFPLLDANFGTRGPRPPAPHQYTSGARERLRAHEEVPRYTMNLRQELREQRAWISPRRSRSTAANPYRRSSHDTQHRSVREPSFRSRSPGYIFLSREPRDRPRGGSPAERPHVTARPEEFGGVAERNQREVADSPGAPPPQPAFRMQDHLNPHDTTAGPGSPRPHWRTPLRVSDLLNPKRENPPRD